MKIYTKHGDKGHTGLFDGRRVRKDDARIETYGTVDELNSVIGLAVVDCGDAPLRELLQRLQHQLFDLGGDLATPLDSRNNPRVRRVGELHVAFLEKHIDAATAELPPLKRFVLPGGNATAARLHVARTVCRRAERLLVRLMAEIGEESIGPQPLIYLNRLSDLLFTLARLANFRAGLPDVEWDQSSAVTCPS